MAEKLGEFSDFTRAESDISRASGQPGMREGVQLNFTLANEEFKNIAHGGE